MGTAAKEKLANTLHQLLESNHSEEITVSMLARESGLARRTFYDNFLDIYDLQIWMHEYLSRNVIEEFGSEPFEQVLFHQLESMRKHQKIYKQLLEMQDTNAFCNKFISVNMERSIQYFGENASKELLFVAQTYTSGAAEQIYRWIQNDMTLSPREMTDLLMLSMPDILRCAYSLRRNEIFKSENHDTEAALN